MVIRGNGTSTSYAYDPVSRLQSLTQDLSGTTHDLSLTFDYNPASQIKTNTRSNDLFAFTSHPLGSTSSTANGLNQLSTHGGATIVNDAKGNLISDGTKTYAYSSENLMTSVSGGHTLDYDPTMRLHQLATNGSATRYGYDGLKLISERDGSGNLLRRFVHGPGVDEPLVWYEGTGTSPTGYLHADERGSIVAVSNNSGNVTAINSYDEYGKPQDSTFFRFQYTGQRYLNAIGLHYYKARMYDDKLGRFMQTDPIGYQAGRNLYAYVGNDPVNFTDPLGLCGVIIERDTATGEEISRSGGTGGACEEEDDSSFSGDFGPHFFRNSRDSLSGDDSASIVANDGDRGGAPAPPKNPSVSQCLLSAAADNAAGAGLAVLGAGAFVLSLKARVAGAIVGGTVSVAALGYSVATKDGLGGVISLMGKGSANAGGIASVGTAFARGANRFGGFTAAAGVLYEGDKIARQFSHCRKGG